MDISGEKLKLAKKKVLAAGWEIVVYCVIVDVDIPTF